MQGLILLATFVVMALISVAVSVFAGLLADSLPHLHDMFSLLVFFGILIVLLPLSWVIALRLTGAPRAPG